MNAEQGFFLTQARSDLRAYDLLAEAEPCHRIHYLQMLTEKLAKAYFWRSGQPPKKRHDYFANFMREIGRRSEVGQAVGIKPSAHWEEYVRAIRPISLAIEQMAPSVAGDGPNAEYPWPPDAPTHAPADYRFPIWDVLSTPNGQRFLALLRRLLDRFEQFA